MIIVSDSGPLAYLVTIGIAESLPTLFGEVYVPPAVVAELRHPECPVSTWASQLPGWIHIAAPKSIAGESSLDLGEREAIALAIELGVNLLLIDEKPGRKAAQAAGLKVAGTLAVILQGAQQGLFDGRATINKLAATNFYAAPELLEQVRSMLDVGLHDGP